MSPFQAGLFPVSEHKEFNRLTGFSFNALDLSAGEDLNPFLAARLLQQIRDVFILSVDQARVPLDDRHAAAEAAHRLS